MKINIETVEEYLNKTPLEIMTLNDEYVVEIIGQLQENNNELLKENRFLAERENKLQLIEQLFLNVPVDLERLSEIVKELPNERVGE